MKTALKDLVKVDLQKFAELTLFNWKINSIAPVCVGSAENSKWIILARPAADYDNLTKNQTCSITQPATHNKI